MYQYSKLTVSVLKEPIKQRVLAVIVDIWSIIITSEDVCTKCELLHARTPTDMQICAAECVFLFWNDYLWFWQFLQSFTATGVVPEVHREGGSDTLERNLKPFCSLMITDGHSTLTSCGFVFFAVLFKLITKSSKE